MIVINKNLNKVEKLWGYELIIHNDEEYCAKMLCFTEKNAKFSMHFHMKKKETWYVNKGSFLLRYINTEKAEKYVEIVKEGDTIEVDRGDPHQLELLSDYGEIFEASTTHFDYDSYRIEKGTKGTK
jgi:mannose-6-phosphate isomerase-like protein (cupin superfamily)